MWNKCDITMAIVNSQTTIYFNKLIGKKWKVVKKKVFLYILFSLVSQVLEYNFLDRNIKEVYLRQNMCMLHLKSI